MDTQLNPLFKLYDGLDRLGPGSVSSTRLAISQIKSDLTENPLIADIGCGRGAQTFVLAEDLKGQITAVDIYQPYLDHIAHEAIRQKLPISVLNADMCALRLTKNKYDLIWSEGAIYIVGFELGLRTWQSFLKPGGFMAVSELSWFREHPPEQAVAYWKEQYPAMKTAKENIALAAAADLQTISHFSLPDRDWWELYYIPLQTRIENMTPAERNEPGMTAVIDETLEEMEIFKKFSYFYGYEFYLLKKDNI